MSEKSLIQKAAADFAAATLAPVSFVPEKTAEYTEDAVKEMAAKGFLKVADLEEAAIVAEEFGKANASMAEVAVIANVTASTLADYGAAADGMTGYAVYEEGTSCGGVTAEKAGDAYKITGTKIAAALGGAADQYIVIATLDGALAAFVVKAADEIIAAAGSDLKYEVGTMIEIPRAALTADEIAKEADFFCFGTNDLTQMTFGFSRDDAGKFLDAYYDAKIFENDPFAKLDQEGVGKLMETALKLGKPVNSKLHCGICGEHGGDPSSVEFCNKIGLDYVSCSPFRVPIARLAAAQAAIAQK